MSAKQTVTTTTTTTREWKKEEKKKAGKAVAKAYSAQLKKAKPKRRVCPTCGRPL
jgi:NAD(P)H-hydrate repair Nnr-like enzyme with NAD(P)H-hydrate epimerase domain